MMCGLYDVQLYLPKNMYDILLTPILSLEGKREKQQKQVGVKIIFYFRSDGRMAVPWPPNSRKKTDHMNIMVQ